LLNNRAGILTIAGECLTIVSQRSATEVTASQAGGAWLGERTRAGHTIHDGAAVHVRLRRVATAPRTAFSRTGEMLVRRSRAMVGKRKEEIPRAGLVASTF
jgi:hypothetical protein